MTEQQNEIEYLYHYTSIESLALILKNRTIRLNPLDKMDDLQEQKTSDVENLGKFVFISSWTDDATESIPMWKLYTDLKAGVRIRMRKNPFLWHMTFMSDLEKLFPSSTFDGGNECSHVETFLSFAEMIDKGYFSIQAWNGKILEKVIYTDDIGKLEPKVADVSDGKIHLDIGILGKYKNTHWEFQKEWRYIMTFMPMDIKSGIDAAMASFNLSVNKMLRGIENPPFRFYDLTIDPKYFSEMEVTCSPQMTPGNRVLLDTLIEKYNPNATIRDSVLLGKI